MRMVSPGRVPARGFLAFLAAGALMAGCRDAPTDPMVGLVAEEAYAALALGVSFPDPSAWAPEDVRTAEGADAIEAWRGSWDLPAEEGRKAREGAYQALNRQISTTVDAKRVEEELTKLSEAVLRARTLEIDAVPPHIASGLTRALSQSTAAREAMTRGDLAGALDGLVRGGDALREVGPEAVARALQSEVEGRLGRVSDVDPYSEEDLERLQRLVRGGRQAVEEGDWGLAIRRAFYAKGILDGNG